MANQTLSTLKRKIIEEMTVDYGSALEKNFDLAKQLIRITKDGKIDVLPKDKLTGTECIILYLIGKLYAKEAELTPTDDASNSELMDELGVPKGSLLPWLKTLRDDNKIKTTTKGKLSYHVVALNVVEKSLKDMLKKVSKEGKKDVS
ncbi:MAG: hypothetical protein ABIH70_04975 [Chloroflexota bacterium]